MAREAVFETVAEHYLAALREHGIEWLFLNAGTDFAPLVEAYARNHDTNAPPFPEPIIATHENLAIGMAHGAYLLTGKPQALMVHVSVGTANAICGLMNAARDQVPILLTAGRSPLFERDELGARDMRIHWGQEMFDQAGMVRELVKWDYELRDARQVDDVVHRAISIASTQPKGPIYLTLPREVLASPAVENAKVDASLQSAPTGPSPDVTAVAQLADRIAQARMPVIMATASGADPSTVAALVQLCERYGIGYAEEAARHLNFPAGHRLHLGYQLAPVFDETDVLCFLECDVPWMPGGSVPRDDAFVAHAGVDPSFSRYPMRSHRADLSVTATAAAFIAALDVALEKRHARIDSDRLERVVQLAKRLRGDVSPVTSEGPITRDAVAAALYRVVDDDTIVFNEYWAPPALLAAYAAADVLLSIVRRWFGLGAARRARRAARGAKPYGGCVGRRRRVHLFKPRGMPSRGRAARITGAYDRLQQCALGRGGSRHRVGLSERALAGTKRTVAVRSDADSRARTLCRSVGWLWRARDDTRGAGTGIATCIARGTRRAAAGRRQRHRRVMIRASFGRVRATR